jgi:outer membrane protease
MKNFKVFFSTFFCLFLLSSPELYAQENQPFSSKKSSQKKSAKISEKNEINNKALTKNEEEFYKHSLTISLDRVNGKADEIVHDGAKKLSHLEWDIKNLKMLSLGLNSQFFDGFGARIKLSTAINQGDGRMIDYDWVGNNFDGNIDHNNWTHRSISDVKIQKAQQFDIAGTYSFYKDELKFNFGYKHDHFKWSDRGGSYIYSEFGFRDDVGNFDDERGITYEQIFQTPYIGLEYQKELFDKNIYANIFGNYSNLVYARGTDIHHQVNLKFDDYFKNGKYYNWGTSIFGKVKENIYLGLGYEFVYYPENRGYAVIQDLETKQSLINHDSAGIKNKYSKISLNLKYNFTTTMNFLN